MDKGVRCEAESRKRSPQLALERPALCALPEGRQVDVPVLGRDAPPGRLDTAPVIAPPSHRSGRRPRCDGLLGLLGSGGFVLA